MLRLSLLRATLLALACILLPAALPAQKESFQRRPLKEVLPTYPISMHRYGIGGEVTVEFVVDSTGKVTNASILASTNPAFNAPALAAVRQWIFKPAIKDGKAVNVRISVPIVFRPESAPPSDRKPGAIAITSENQAELPPERRYDVAPRLRNLDIPIYPHALRAKHLAGEAEVSLAINARGRVTAVEILSATTPEFGLALVAAAESFTFAPAFRGGEPVATRLNFKHVFDETEMPDAAGDLLLALEEEHPERIVLAPALDAPLRLVTRRSPTYPLALPRDVGGEAIVEFLVDEEGFVRLPRLVSATEPAFGYAAVQASIGLIFDLPHAGQKPAVARVRVPFRFAGETIHEAEPKTPLNADIPVILFARSDLDKPPQPKKQGAPRFPDQLRRAGSSGEVMVELVIDRLGKVKNVRALKSPHELFSAAAVAAVEKWEFAPGLISGQPVDVLLQVPVIFSINR